MNYTVQAFPTGRVDVPWPEVYWMEGFGEWAPLEFQMILIRGEGQVLVINTGFPPDIAPLAQAWRNALGDRAALSRPEECRPERILAAQGIAPEDVGHVLITPIQLYATGNLRLFPKARMVISRTGFIEDVIAPTYPHHVPRRGCIADADLFWLLGENHGNLLLAEDGQEILPGIRCHEIGVHHRSSMLIEVQTAKGRVMISDCAFHFQNVEEGRPLGIAESILEAHAAYARIRKEADFFVPLYEPRLRERYPEGRIA